MARYQGSLLTDVKAAHNTSAIRLLGDFPDASHDALIPPNVVLAAVDRDVAPTDHAVVWGLDIARYGDDTTALAKRHGNVLLEPVKEWSKLDIQVSGVIAREDREARERGGDQLRRERGDVDLRPPAHRGRASPTAADALPPFVQPPSRGYRKRIDGRLVPLLTGQRQFCRLARPKRHDDKRRGRAGAARWLASQRRDNEL